MSVNLSAFAGAGWQFFDDNGDPLTGGKLYTYAAGTTTPAVTYTSQNGGTAHSNPIILDAAGRVADEIWLTSDASYKFQLKDSNDVLIGTYDNIYGIVGSDIPGTVNVENFTGNGTQTTFILAAPPGGVNNTQVFINGVYQFKNTYSVSGSSIIFTQAPPPAASKIEVLRFSTFSVGTLNADQVIYDPAGTGAVATTVQAKLRETVSVKDFGAVGDGVTDDTVAIQAAIDYLSPLGGTLHFPKGAYIVSDANADNACLVVTAPIQFLGDGAFYTSIQPAASVAGTVNTILVNPNTGFDQTLMSFRKLSLGNLNNGTRQGNHGIYCLTLNAGQNLPKFTVEDCAIQQGGGAAIYHLNDPVDNINGGMYACYINNNTLKGGITFENSGDSLVVSNNILSGTGTGVSASLVTGASLLSILDNNITTTNSAIIIASGMRVSILRNNIEHYTTGSNSNAVIDIVSSGGTYVAGVIQQNLVSAFGATDANKLIAIREARGTLIQDNTFLAGVGGITAINISNTCTAIRVGANSYNAGLAAKVSDSGVGTMGVAKTITLQNSWVANTAADTPTYYKDLSGNVVIEGAIKDGTATSGTTLFALPLGFRPPAGTLKRFNAYSVGGGGAEFGRFDIDEDGVARIEDGANTLFNLSGAIFRANDGANSVSPE